MYGKITYLGSRNPWTDRYKILYVGCRPGCNHARQFLWRSVKGFWCGEGSNFGLFIDLLRRLLNTLALPCECVMRNLFRLIQVDSLQFFLSVERTYRAYGCCNTNSAHICPYKSELAADGWFWLSLTPAGDRRHIKAFFKDSICCSIAWSTYGRITLHYKKYNAAEKQNDAL